MNTFLSVLKKIIIQHKVSTLISVYGVHWTLSFRKGHSTVEQTRELI